MSKKYLRYTNALRGTLIENDKGCRYCGYNLRGLRFGGNCPECGTTILLEHSLQDALTYAPLAVIKRLRLGFWMAMVLLPAMLLLPFAIAMVRGNSVMFVAGLMIISIAWVVAVWMMTPAIEIPGGVRRGFSEHSKLRWSARLLQLGWVVSTLGLLGGIVAQLRSAGVATQISNLLGLVSLLGALVGLADVVVLSVLMRRLAEWCSDDFAGKLLDWTSVGIPLCAIVSGISFAMRSTLLLGCFFLFLLIVTMIGFALAMALLGKAITWSVRHAQETQQRDIRRRQPRSMPSDEQPGPPPADDEAISLAD